jgi:hypothetical protein
MRIGRGPVLAVLPALLILFVPVKAGASSFGPVRQRVMLGDWRLTIATDRFSGERRCRLATRKGNIAYSDGTATIRLSGVFNASEAVIRVDNGAPVRWRDLIPALARLDPGFASEGAARQLPIPAELVKYARAVAVSPAFGKRARTYRVAGFDVALERAAALGCRPDAAFVR